MYAPGTDLGNQSVCAGTHPSDVLSLVSRRSAHDRLVASLCLGLLFRMIKDLSRRIILHHDNASCYTSAETSRFFEGQKIELTSLPPYSPDLVSNDFYLFPSVKNKLGSQRFSSCKEAVHALKMHIWSNLNRNGKANTWRVNGMWNCGRNCTRLGGSEYAENAQVVPPVPRLVESADKTRALEPPL
ncbi:hypothetical protein EVAR_14934_1 [Eumeta japonica]|uniref:Mariner Mos1 transposase n=1 Tax=Eumeta variegata TaxID=151549 RepID=A0A4C1XQ86_EUMVA|nr:hypothetical protein EVAR_14934_1 [Eumeta japonica]